MLLDRNSFVEIGSQMADYGYCAGGNKPPISSDGVITGRGRIRGKTVFVFAQDFSVKGGTIGRRHGGKIGHIIKLAISARSPVIGIYDSGGARIEEGINALAGCGEMLHLNTLASGEIPQYSIIVGPCAGAAAYSPALMDFVFIVDNISCMLVTRSEVVGRFTGEECTNQELGGAEMHSTLSGVAHRRFSNEKDCFRCMRDLVEMLPASSGIFHDNSSSFMDKEAPIINSVLPSESHLSYDMKRLFIGIVDENSFIEIGDNYAKSIITGFARLSGHVVGIVANQPLELGGSLNCDSSDKAARFIRFCDCFNIPIITFVDTPGYLPGKEQEHRGIIRHGAKLLFAYSEATAPKITIIIRKAYGGAYIAMGSKHVGADYVYALSGAEIAVMGAEGAAAILYKKEISQIEGGEERKTFIFEKAKEYREKFMNVLVAVEEGFVDEVIEYQDLRRRIFDDIVAMAHKCKSTINKRKHGNIPL